MTKLDCVTFYCLLPRNNNVKMSQLQGFVMDVANHVYLLAY